MSDYTKTNLKEDVENQAPNFGMPAELEARFARRDLDGETLGLSHMKLAPSFRIPFGHKHVGQEEVYVVVSGSARIKVEDEIVELGQWDAIRIAKDTDAGRRGRPRRRRVPRLRRRHRPARVRGGAGLVERLAPPTEHRQRDEVGRLARPRSAA